MELQQSLTGSSESSYAHTHGSEKTMRSTTMVRGAGSLGITMTSHLPPALLGSCLLWGSFVGYCSGGPCGTDRRADMCPARVACCSVNSEALLRFYLFNNAQNAQAQAGARRLRHISTILVVTSFLTNLNWRTFWNDDGAS